MKRLILLFAVALSVNVYSADAYYIAGDGSAENNWCCGLHWDPDACPLDADNSYTTTLEAGMYSFKITRNGVWGGSLSFNNLDVENSIECTSNSDRNIIFSLSEKSTVTISVVDGKVRVRTGNMPAPVACNPSSGTLPVMYIFTDGNQDITSKDVYINANFYIDALGLEGYTSLGSADAMLATQIKGRGNYTWTGFDKKPYRLKLAAKNSLLNMKKSKHFTLLAHADDRNAFLRNTLGFECSRLFGLAYTPAQEPLELYINGDYKGIYFLTEQIRIDKDRVNITEQEEEETDPELVTGGWLLEIDNYWEDSSIQFQMIEKGEDWLKVTSKSPEVMSDVQYNYMYNYLYNTNKAIQDKGDWEKYIDLETLVNFYLVNEVMGNHEAFHGSCYMHKDQGADTKLMFGPVWDFGSSLGWQGRIYDSPLWGDTWIDDLSQFPQFQEKARERWLAVRGILYPKTDELARKFVSQVKSAAECDCKRWPDYGNKTMESSMENALSYLNDRMAWLDTYWGTTNIPADPANIDSESVSVYPNPVESVINVSGAEDLAYVSVLDIGGRTILDLDPSKQSWNLDLESGTYIMVIGCSNGNVFRFKIVKR